MFLSSNSSQYKTLINQVASITSNQSVQSKLAAFNLKANSVSWEDTSRYSNSCLGSNITDVTLLVDNYKLPMIRGDNFIDTTVDLSDDKLPKLVVGNESGKQLETVTLKEYLQNFDMYCGMDVSDRLNLYHERDSHVLTSAQACVLPSDQGKVEFAVNAYNYQSYGNEPAILIIMATPYGTSAQVVSGGNTNLYFNDNGKGRLFKAERLSDYRASKGQLSSGTMTTQEKALNGIYIFQVPLKVERSERGMPKSCLLSMQECCFMDTASMSVKKSAVRSRGMERAILTIGEEKGPYKGIEKSRGVPHKLIRDTERPIRLTVQFYMCTDTNDISEDNVKEISEQIRKIYDQGLNEGSLVVNGSVAKPGLPNTQQPKRPTQTTSKNFEYVTSYGIL